MAARIGDGAAVMVGLVPTIHAFAVSARANPDKAAHRHRRKTWMLGTRPSMTRGVGTATPLPSPGWEKVARSAG